MSLQPFGALETGAVRLLRDDVDTDQIIPARFLTTTSRSGLGRHLFADWRFDERGVPRADFALAGADPATTRVLVAGRNFGCGSSREHAAWALLDWGFRAVIATSFADIFRNNAHKNGLLTIALTAAEHAALLAALDGDGAARVHVQLADGVVTAGSAFRAPFTIDPFSRHCLLEGVDELGFLLAESAAIAAFEHEMAPLVPTNQPRAAGSPA